MMTLADTMSYLFAAAIFTAFMLIFNPALGAVAFIGSLVLVLVGEIKYKKGISLSGDRQEQSERLTKAVLDYIEGIGITKTYNLLGDKSKEMSDNFEKSRYKLL